MRDTELRPQHVFDCAASILDSFRKLQYDKLWEVELWLSFLVGCWEPPPDGWFKLNVDAAVDGDRGLVGFGAWRRVMVAGVNQASLVYNFDFAEVEDLQFAIGRRIGFLSCDSIGVE